MEWDAPGLKKKPIDLQWYSRTVLLGISNEGHSTSIQLGIKEYIDSNWFLFKDRNRNHWQVVSIEIPWESKETLIWNEIKLVFKRAIDVEWYSKPVSLGIKSIDF